MATGLETTHAQQEISRAVSQSTEGAITDLSVQVRSDDVVISGHAASYYVKQLATQAAMGASNGLAVRNEIYVHTR